MKYTLLELTQEILSAMDSDEVTSINDTAESLQVARAVRQAYYDMVEDINPPEHYTMFELVQTDANSPTKMSLPSDIGSLKWVKYNKIRLGETSSKYEEIYFMPFKDFLDRMYHLDTDESNVGSYTVTVHGSDLIDVFYIDDRAPTYYTVLGDDSTIIFDSYDSGIDTFLSQSKTEAYGKKLTSFSLTDGFTPELDEHLFTRLLNEAKVLAFAELKSVDHAIANRNARRARVRDMVRKDRIKRESDFDRLPYFGRK